MKDNYKTVEELLARRIGLDPVAIGPHLVARATRRRMAELGLATTAEYVALLVASEAELQALIEEVVVPESWFFRDDRPFRWLADHVRANWVAVPGRALLRALSMPCAGGQEPYSIAITLLDAGLRPSRFHIDAVDVSTRMLEIARRGVYSANAFRGAGDSTSEPSPPAAQRRWMRYFDRQGHVYELDPSVRMAVQFHQASVLDPMLLKGRARYDVVFCRNLLIYLGAAARALVLSTLDRLLADDGVLFIGHADRLESWGERSGFVAAGEPGCFAYRKAPHPSVADNPNSSLDNSALALMLPEPSPLRLIAGEIPAADAQAVINAAAPAANLAARPRDGAPEPALLDQAADLANRGRFAEAISACERHVRGKGPSAEAFYLMGTIHQAAGDRKSAEACFHKAIYLDPRHDEALLALALLAERRGDHDAANGFRRRARRTAGTGRTTNGGEP